MTIVAREELAKRDDLTPVSDPGFHIIDEVAAQEGIGLGKARFPEERTATAEGVGVPTEALGYPGRRCAVTPGLPSS